MPKKTKDFVVPINVLIRDDGTRQLLIAIAYFRGEGGSYAGPVRDALGEYTRKFMASLTPAERRRFDEIHGNVTTTEAYRKQVAADAPRKSRRHS